MLKVKGQDQEGIKAALTAECVADVRTDGTEATIIVSAATNFVNYHDVSGNAAQRNADYINKVKLMSYAQLECPFRKYRKNLFPESFLQYPHPSWWTIPDILLPLDLSFSLPAQRR